MVTPIYLVPILAITVSLLIRAEQLGIKQQVYLFKPLSTILVVTAGACSLLSRSINQTFTIGILIGLVLSLGGDIALMFQDKRQTFLVGLGLFLLTHTAYAIVFFSFGRVTAWDLLTAGILVVAAVIFYPVIKPNLGSLQGPVIVYMIIISLMLSRAFSTYFSPVLSTAAAWMVFLGAVLFYLSDLILAANRFWRPWKYNRISLAMYYCGQMLIALSASYFS